MAGPDRKGTSDYADEANLVSEGGEEPNSHYRSSFDQDEGENPR
jgi:hypothetical protein